MNDLTQLPISRSHPARCIRVHYRDEELLLAPTLMTDAEEIALAVNESLTELRRFMPWAHLAQSAKSQLERLRSVEGDYFSGRELNLGLFRERPHGQREVVVILGLHPRVPLNPAALEVGYWARTRYAGQGYTTFAVQCAIVYAFDKLGADRVQVMCDQANVASRRVIEKCGFAFEASMRGMTAAPTPELTRAGYLGNGPSLMHALFPETFVAMSWVDAVRSTMRYENVAGYAET